MARRLARFFVALIASVGGLTVLSVLEPVDAGATQSSSSQWLRIVDVSNWQTSNINWQAVKGSGIVGAYVEFGDGNWTSQTFQAQSQGAATAGLSWGAYYFAEPNTTDPVASADRFMAAANAGNLPPVLDLETGSASAGAWAETFLARCSQDGGRVPTLYTGLNYAWSSSPALTAYPLWLSDYVWGYTPVPNVALLPVPSAGQWGSWSGWQFTSVANVPGVPGSVDLSVFEPAWWELYTGAGVAPTGGRPGVVWVEGSSGPPVVQIQQQMTAAGLYHGLWNGYYSSDLTTAVAQWQQRLGITSDGAWGPATQRATDAYVAFLKSLHHPIKRPRPVLRQNDKGQNVIRLQRALDVLHFHPKHAPLGLNGHYGQATATSVAILDAKCHLPAHPDRFGHIASRCLRHKLARAGR